MSSILEILKPIWILEFHSHHFFDARYDKNSITLFLPISNGFFNPMNKGIFCFTTAISTLIIVLLMKKIDRNMKPEWSVEPDSTKEKWIMGLVNQQLVPRFGDIPIFMEFFDYLNSHSNFKSSAHYYRYLQTFGLISQIGIDLKSLKVVEVGGASPISTFLSRYNSCFNTESDLRSQIDVDDEFADLVLSFEVIEHLKDQPEKNFDEIVLFQESGVKTFASECYRVLTPGGNLIATTPNCVSYKAIERAINQQPPYVFRPHVRDYSKEELVDIFADLNMVVHETMFNFFFLSDVDQKNWDQVFQAQGWPTTDRGDNHFLVFRKPDTK